MQKKIAKDNWAASFCLVGKPKKSASGDFNINIDETSNSGWRYNSMFLNVDCGEKHGSIGCEMSGGYWENRSSHVIYAHGKNDDGSDDYTSTIQVDWNDRFNESILETVGDMCFTTVGLEKTENGSTVVKKFLSAYDAINYINEHLTDDMVVQVRGTMRYSIYQGNTQIRKNITSIMLSKTEKPEDFKAEFKQSILIDKDSASLKDIDKEKGIMYVNARVLDYIKEVNGVEIKGQYPYNVQFEYPMDTTDAERCKKIYDLLFKVRKDITQITFVGDLIEGGAVVQATLDDISDDIKELIAAGVYTEEEALVQCSTNSGKERRMILKQPMIKRIDGKPTVQKYEGKYTEDDFDFGNASDDTEDDDWLAALDAL